MVVGVRKNDTGKVVMYRSPDLIDWEFAGVIAESDVTMGYMLECPEFFAAGGTAAVRVQCWDMGGGR
ncbi:hypothetical protein ABEV00_15110 [Paenibacillus thiaminolyticus]